MYYHYTESCYDAYPPKQEIMILWLIISYLQYYSLISDLFSYTIVHVKLSISLPIKSKNRLRQLHYLRSFVFYDYEYEFKNKMSPCSWLVHDHFLSVLDGQAWITFSSHLWTNQYSLPTHIHTSVCIWHNQSCFIAIYDFFFWKRVLLCI